MQIYVGNLPDDVGPDELKQLFRNYGNFVGFRVQETHLEDGRTLRYAYGVIVPDKAAERAIERLDQSRLDGNRIEVRKYVHRVSGNERRDLNWEQEQCGGPERRHKERRKYTGYCKQ